jgi:DsbC/DsbD-like thiol-disulfide interchange protein
MIEVMLRPTFHRVFLAFVFVLAFTYATAYVLGCFLGVEAAPAAQSFKSSQQHAMVRLVAERTAAVPGQAVSIGVQFEIDPRWHIYWRNPGDSGGPPIIEWQLPDGFQAGELQWPAPKRIEVSTLINYGYESDVLLPLTLHVPATAKPGSEVALAGHVKYLICSDLCVPGNADVKLTLPIAASAASAGAPSPAADLFAQARTQLPQPAPRTWVAKATFGNRHFDLSVQTGKREASGTFFPLVPSQIDDSAPPQITPTDRGIRFGLRASDQLTAEPHTLTGVLVLADGKAYTISAPVTPAGER